MKPNRHPVGCVCDSIIVYMVSEPRHHNHVKVLRLLQHPQSVGQPIFKKLTIGAHKMLILCVMSSKHIK
jgi:hypothetical protein